MKKFEYSLRQAIQEFRGRVLLDLSALITPLLDPTLPGGALELLDWFAMAITVVS